MGIRRLNTLNRLSVLKQPIFHTLSTLSRRSVGGVMQSPETSATVSASGSRHTRKCRHLIGDNTQKNRSVDRVPGTFAVLCSHSLNAVLLAT